MNRGPSALPAFSMLGALLIVLQFLAPAASFASAHTARHVVAKDQSGTKPSGAASRDQVITCHETELPGDPTGPLRARGRQRTSDYPGVSEHPLPAHRASTTLRPATPGSAASPTARPSIARSLTALQVVRC